MASLIRKPDGIYQIQFSRHQRRHTLSLGSVAAKDARSTKAHAEAILEARWIGAALAPSELTWLDKIDDALHAKLAKLGLVPSRARAQLKPFLADYIASRTDVGKYTRINLNQSAAKLVEHFGETTTIDKVTHADAKRWAREIVGADATRGRLILYARQFFKHAVDSRLLTENPFRGIKAPKQTSAKHFLIDPALAQPAADPALGTFRDLPAASRLPMARQFRGGRGRALHDGFGRPVPACERGEIAAPTAARCCKNCRDTRRAYSGQTVNARFGGVSVYHQFARLVATVCSWR